MTKIFVWLLIILVFLYGLIYSVFLWIDQNRFASFFIFVSTLAILLIPLILGLEQLDL